MRIPLYSDGTYAYFVLPDRAEPARGHMPFKGHRTVAEVDAAEPKRRAA